jgi:hypothetical protein
MHLRFKLHLTLSVLLLLSAKAFAQSVPNQINYQGRLTDQTGAPLAAGAYGLQFRLWDSPTATNGSDLIWGQQQNVTVQSNGVFHAILGSAAGFSIAGAVPAVNDLTFAFTATNRYLGVTAITQNSTPISAPGEILPRQQLLSAPYAMQAQAAQIASTLVTNAAYALSPPGSVVAYMGSTPPFGWLLCDGSAVSRSQFQDLFGVLATSSGSGDGLTTFNLPDMRGMFLRGVLGIQTNVFPGTTNTFDPDALTRTNLFPGGSVGNAVGSIEADQFRSHIHDLPMGTGSHWDQCCNAQPATLPGINSQSSPAGGCETRPVNIYVNYIIKY